MNKSAVSEALNKHLSLNQQSKVVVVGLGNTVAATEGEILNLAQRMAAAGVLAGMTEAEVFGFAATLTSVGVRAERGGTASWPG